MAWTADDLAALRAALATGAKRVRFQSHETEFRSQDEMLALVDIIEQELSPATAPVRRTVARFHRGFGNR